MKTLLASLAVLALTLPVMAEEPVIAQEVEKHMEEVVKVAAHENCICMKDSQEPCADLTKCDSTCPPCNEKLGQAMRTLIVAAAEAECGCEVTPSENS